MQRRAVYPSAATSISLARCSVEAQLLFTRIIAAADDQGRLQGDPMLVKAQCMPLVDKATTKNVDRWLDELGQHKMILRYEAGEQSLIQVVKWWEHQGWLRHLFPSRWPAPDGFEDRTKGHGSSADGPPDDGQASADRPPSGRPDVVVDVDVSDDVDFDADVDVDRAAADAPATPPPPEDISLHRVTTTHFDLTGKRVSDGGRDMYRDLLRQFGFDIVNRAQWNVGASDKADRGFIGRVKTQCKRLAA
jgi:hypothetical protein